MNGQILRSMQVGFAHLLLNYVRPNRLGRSYGPPLALLGSRCFAPRILRIELIEHRSSAELLEPYYYRDGPLVHRSSRRAGCGLRTILAWFVGLFSKWFWQIIFQKARTHHPKIWNVREAFALGPNFNLVWNWGGPLIANSWGGQAPLTPFILGARELL